MYFRRALHRPTGISDVIHVSRLHCARAHPLLNHISRLFGPLRRLRIFTPLHLLQANTSPPPPSFPPIGYESSPSLPPTSTPHECPARRHAHPVRRLQIYSEPSSLRRQRTFSRRLPCDKHIYPLAPPHTRKVHEPADDEIYPPFGGVEGRR